MLGSPLAKFATWTLNSGRIEHYVDCSLILIRTHPYTIVSALAFLKTPISNATSTEHTWTTLGFYVFP
jgi:hypothetical protein